MKIYRIELAAYNLQSLINWVLQQETGNGQKFPGKVELQEQ